MSQCIPKVFKPEYFYSLCNIYIYIYIQNIEYIGTVCHKNYMQKLKFCINFDSFFV